MNEILKAENITHALLSTMLVGGVLVCYFFNDSPDVVTISSMTAFAGWLGSNLREMV